MAVKMAFHVGGIEGLEKARKAKTVNTVQLNSGIEISGVLSEFLLDKDGNVAYLLLTGPCQLAHDGKELQGHSRQYHQNGYGTAVGHIVQKPEACPSEMSVFDWKNLGVIEGNDVELNFTSGVQIKGHLKSTTARGNRLVLMSFEKCTVKMGDHLLFRPEWGTYDLAVGCRIPSVYGGPADRDAYGELVDLKLNESPSRILPKKIWNAFDCTNEFDKCAKVDK
jgi:phenylalanine-4-hydroxylase